MIVAFSVSPTGGDTSVGAAVMAVVKQAVDAVAAVSDRVSLVLKADIRPGYTGQLTAKVQRIEEALGD